MELHPAPDDPQTKLFNRLVSNNGSIEMGVYRVMYGHRVRGGFVGCIGCELDWCGGENWKDVERLYAIMRAILAQRPEDRKCFAGLPGYSEIKPFYLDLDFVAKVGELAGDMTVQPLTRIRAEWQLCDQ